MISRKNSSYRLQFQSIIKAHGNKFSTNSKKLIRKLPTDGPKFTDFIQNTTHEVSKVSTISSEMSFPITSNIVSLDTILSKKKRSFHIETYGCQMNSADSEIVRSILLSNSFEKASTIEDADIVLLNTCAIRENAEIKIWNKLEQLKQRKEKHLRLHKKAKVKKSAQTIGVLGCMAERLKTKLLEADKMVDLVVGPDAYRDLPNLLQLLYTSNQETAVNTQLSIDETYADIAPVRTQEDSASAFVSIMRGCNNMCSYCIVPFTRGRERSRDMISITQEVQTLVDQGVKEIVLLGQNVNSYWDRSSPGAQENGRGYIAAPGFNNMYKSRDANGYRFVDLLERVSSVHPELRIRFTSPHPKDFPEPVLQLMSERPNLCKSLHVPAQSGSTSVLDRMRRGYSRESYLDLIACMRDILPGVSLSSDFIAGFCGESEFEHRQTVSLMQQVAFDQAFMFAYSVRQKTHAAYKMEDNVSQDVKLRRLQEIIDTFGSIVTRKNVVEDEGRLHLVLVEGESKRSKNNEEETKMLTGLTDTNKRCMFPSISVPGSLREYTKNHINTDLFNENDFNPIQQSLNEGVELNRGDYVLVRIRKAGRHTLHGDAIARTTLVETHAMLPAGAVGARPHNYDMLEIDTREFVH